MTIEALERTAEESGASADVIDRLVGITPGDALDTLRAGRPAARVNAQATYDALFSPVDYDSVSAVERDAIAAFIAGLHAETSSAEHYGDRLAAHGDEALDAAVRAEITLGRTEGPYGDYREVGLADESVPGPVFRVSPGHREALGERLTAALEHVHLIVFHPRDTRAEHHDALLNAGWTTTGIVTVSQLVAFLAFQIRVIAGLTELAAALPTPPAASTPASASTEEN